MSILKDDSTYEVWFVRGSKGEGVSSEDKLQLAFEAMDSNHLEPVWATEEEVLKINKKESKLFVMDPFEGEAFEHLKSVRCRIVGPLCILYCLQFGDVLPKRPYPVYSVSMRKMTVSCSNIDSIQREDISRKVQLMGGLFSKDLTKSVSHLVVGEVGSKKYQVAASFGLLIMTPDWIEDMWRNGQYQLMHASDASCNKFKCPVFKGLVVTVSQLSAEERTAVQSVVTENGGTYLAPLKAHKTTHLVLTEPTGDKYRYAKTWKVFCVNVNWIYESIKTGYCKDESLYKIDDSTARSQPKRSTPNKDLTSLDLPVMDCSVITNASIVTHLDETVKSDVSFQVGNNRKTSLKASLEAFDLSSLPKYGQFLDGCKIFLTGFHSAHLDKLRKIVNSGGGIRFSKYTESISHVVCGDLSPEFRQTLKDSSVQPYIVNHDWLLECCKKETLVDEKPFLCMDVSLLSPEKEEPEPKKTSFSQPPKPQSSRLEDETPDNITSIFNQYVSGQNLDGDKISEAPENTTVDQQPNGDPRNNSLTMNENGNVNHQEDEIDDGDESPGSEQLFAGLKFVILGFGEKDADILTRMIDAHSGVVLKSNSSKADIAVVPIIHQEFKTQVPNVVTNCWLQKCIEDSRIYDFDENELFRPVQVVAGKMPFVSYVISVSQYTGTERDCLMHLAEVLGATCQEYFVRKANNSRGILSNTHLIVATPEGSKYEAAKKWEIPAVTKHWVLDTAKLGFPPPIEQYLVDDVVPLQDDDAFKEIMRTSNNSKENLKYDPALTTSSSTSKHVTPRRNADGMQIASTSRLSRKSDGFAGQHELDSEFKTPIARFSSSRGKSLRVENGTNETPVASFPKVSTPQPHIGLETGPKAEQNFVTPHRNVAALKRDSKLQRTVSPIVPKGESSLNDTSDSLNLDQSFKPKFRVSGLLKELDCSTSQELSMSSKRRSLRVEEMFGRNLASALKGISDKMQLTNDSTLDLEKSSFSESYHQPKEVHGVLKGVVVYVAKKLQHLQSELNDVVCEMGGEFLWSYDSTCTHFVFTGKANDLTKEFREARSQGKKVVCPEWVYACKEKNVLPDEELFPHTLKSNMTLADEISILKTSSQNINLDKGNNGSAKVDIPLKNAETAKSVPLVKDATPAKADLQSTSGEGNVADFNQQLNDLLVAAKSAKRRQSKRVLDSVSSSPNNDVSPMQRHLQQKRLSSSFVKSVRPEENATAGEDGDLGSQQSQSCPVVWDDPTGRMEREKIAAALTAAKNAASPPIPEGFSCADMHTLDFEISNSKNSLMVNAPMDEGPPLKTKKFMFTIVPDREKLEYVEIVRSLGGEVSDEKSFDMTASHLIMPKPMKNEKFLSSIAAGKWVLHPQYLLACQEQKKFLPEEDFEWGGPCTVEFIKNVPNSSKKFAYCPFQWRDRLRDTNGGGGAFRDWNVVVIADDKTKQSTYVKILEAGGAVVVPPSETTSSVLETLTHVIVDMKKRSLSQVDLSPYASQSIKCVKPEYLAFYLIEDPPPDVETFVIPEVKEMLNASSKRRNLSIATRGSKKSRLT